MSTSIISPPNSPDLRETISGSLANNLIHNEEPDPEQQPLRRQNSTTANRERFQQNQRTAAQGVVQRSGWVLLIAIILLSMLFFVWVVFYFQGWRTWKEFRGKPCDQPLADWLLAMLLLPILAMVVEVCSCKNLRFPVIFFTVLSLLIGLRMFYKTKTCDETNPELYAFIRQYLIFLTIWWVSWVVMPLIFAFIVIYGMWHGWFDQLNGASPDTIKNIETVDFDPSLFAEEGKTDDGKPAPECCICTETFNEVQEIKRTQCQHYFHEECLGKWLKVSTSCPLCRNDLEKATLGESSSTASSPPQQRPSIWPGNFGFEELSESATSAHEAQEIQTLLQAFPGLDETTALHAVRQSGSAEQAAAILGEP